LSSGEGRPRVTSRGKVGRHIAVVDRVDAFRKELEAARAAGRTVGFVPTVGYLHEGHASLIRRAAAECDVVAVSVFVNPLQFAPTEDLGAYPRDLERDVAVAEVCGAHLLLSPSTEEMYPEAMATTVSVGSVVEGGDGVMCSSRFAGVATVVTKLVGLARRCRVHFREQRLKVLSSHRLAHQG